MPNDTSRGAGHGGPNAPPSAQEGHAGDREAAAVDHPIDKSAPEIRTAEANVPHSTPSEKNPRLAATLMGIPTVALSTVREKSIAVDRQIRPSTDLKPPPDLTPPAEASAQRGTTRTAEATNLLRRSGPSDSTENAVKQPRDQAARARVPPDFDDERDEDLSDEQVASSVIGRCLIGAAIGASLALLLIAIVRTHERSNADQDVEGRNEAASPPNSAIPRWKPAATPSTSAPARNNPVPPGDPAVLEGQQPRKEASAPERAAASGSPEQRGGDALPAPTGDQAEETAGSEPSETPTSDASAESDSIRATTSRPRRPPLRSTTGASPARDGIGARPSPPPPDTNSEPSWSPPPTGSPSASPPMERPRSKNGSSSDPDSTMPPTTN